jgi:TolB-like protein/class 3 adenylate cyclase
VVGYSRLTERDEDRTLARLKALRTELIEPLIAEYQGRVVKLMGDGLLTEFASVVDAVRCAVLIQRGMAEREAGVPEADRLRFRIGINLGDVIREADGDLYGDGVNVAARLEQLAEPGGVIVSGTAYDQLQGKLDLPLEFTGEQRVKNIERLVRTYRVRLDGRTTRLGRLSRRAQRFTLQRAAAVALLLVAAAGTWQFWPRQPINQRPGIAVLPFSNYGGDEVTGRLADGLTEDTITDLARYRDLDVIARNSTEVYKSKPVDVRQVGRDLGVAYVLEGSIQRQGEHLRVTAQLIEAVTGGHLWVESWDRPVADIFAVQTEIAQKIGATLAGFRGIVQEDGRIASLRKRPESLTAYDLYLQGTDARRESTRESAARSLRLLQQATAEDPGFARAWAGLAWAYEEIVRWPESPEQEKRYYELQLEAARRAVELDPVDAAGHEALGEALGNNGDLSQAAVEFQKALDLNPSSADILAQYASWASSFGEPEKGVAAADRARRLNPHMPLTLNGAFAYAYFMVGRYEDAARLGLQMPKETRGKFSYTILAGSLGALGRTEEAKEAVDDLRSVAPGITIERIINDPSWRDEERARLTEALRKAGLPACAEATELAKLDKPRHLPECGAS